MNARLKRWWASHGPRERAVIAALGIVLAITLYAVFLHSASRARSQLAASVGALRMQSARLEQHAVELEKARAVPAPSPSTSELRAVIQAQAGESGVSAAMERIDSLDASQATAVFGAVAFADWLNWIEALNSQRIRLENCRIEALPTPGMVSVTATLVRPPPQ